MSVHNAVAKVPAVTLAFWLVKILATTLGETGGDAVSMSLDLGYLIGTLLFAVLFAVMVGLQIRAPRFHAALYWVTIVATTTVGTTLADFATRSIGIGYPGGSLLLTALLLASFALWLRVQGSVAVESITTRKAEAFYWLTIMFSQTLGTALGDWTADSLAMGYNGAALLFGGLLLLIATAWRFTPVSRTALFWAAFVLTRPLGAVVGDFLDKPIAKGGLELSRAGASAVLAALMILLLLVWPQRAAARAH